MGSSPDETSRAQAYDDRRAELLQCLILELDALSHFPAARAAFDQLARPAPRPDTADARITASPARKLLDRQNSVAITRQFSEDPDEVSVTAWLARHLAMSH